MLLPSPFTIFAPRIAIHGYSKLREHPFFILLAHIMTDYKLIVLDLDGTLTNSKKEITPATRNALLQVQELGIKVVLASGRPTYGIMPLADELQMQRYGGYILSYNGGQIIDCSTGKRVFETVLPDEIVPQLYAASQEFGTTLLSYDGRYILTEEPENIYVRKEAFLNKMEIKGVTNFLEALPLPVTKCLMVGDGEHLAKVTEIMQQRFGDRISVYRSEPFFLELVAQHIDKARSLERLLSLLDLTPTQMIACGDGYNDLSMIRFAGLGVAMANAQQEVKENADYITSSNDDEGVTKVIERFILNG